MSDLEKNLGLKGLKSEAKSILRCNTLRLVRPAPAPRKSFMLFGTGRNGSTLMVSLLNSHPEVSCLGETLHYPARAPVAMIRRELRWRLATPYRGFKLLAYHMRDQMDPERTAAIRQMLIDDGIGIIHIKRENLLRLALSNIYARQRRVFHSDQRGAGTSKVIEVDPAELMRWMRGLEETSRWESDWLGELPRQEVIYETDLATPAAQQAALDRVLAGLGLDPVQVGTPLRPVTPREIGSFVSNWDQVAGSLQGTEFEHYVAA